MNRVRIYLIIATCSVASLTFSGCPGSGLSDEEILRLNDSIVPVVIIASHSDNDPYAPVTTITGTITDAANADGVLGEVDTAVFDVNGGQQSDVTVGSDGRFSFGVDTSGITGTTLITVSATDWNGNIGSSSVALAAPKEITYFAFLASNPVNAASGVSADAIGQIAGTQITVLIAEETDVTALVATFETTGIDVSVATIEQTSGSTVNDFLLSVTCVVSANDGSTKAYTVAVGAMPIAPSDLTISNVTINSIDLSWTDNADNDDGLEIERSGNGGDFLNLGTIVADLVSYSDIGLAPLTSYTYRVRAFNSVGSSSWSNETNAITHLVAQRAKLLASDGAAGDQFGNSVSISDSYAIIGALFDEGQRGSVYMFERGGTGTWQEVQKLTASEGDSEDFFGTAVSVSGSYTVIGAWQDEENGTWSGSAYVFERDGTGIWQEVQKLTASDAGVDNVFGSAVSVSGNYAVIGAPGDDDNGNWSGSAYVFERDGSGTWQEVQKITASDGAINDRFGYSVSVSGIYAVIGAYRDDDNGTESGSTYVFERDGTGTWQEVQKLVALDGDADDNFGCSVSVSGDYVVIGANLDEGQVSGSGSSYLFERDGAGTWLAVQKLIASDNDNQKNFGSSVSVSGSYIATGAYRDDDYGVESGSAYVFEE